MHQEEIKEMIKINQCVNWKGKYKIKNKHLKKAKNDQRIYDLINRERHPSDKTYCSNKKKKRKKRAPEYRQQHYKWPVHVLQ